MKKRFVLDACALIAFLNDEEGADEVEKILQIAKQEKAQIFINQLNLLEVYYGVYREDGKEVAEEILSAVSKIPIKIIERINDAILKEAGRLKATYKISIADAVAVAQAKTKHALLVTADHHELDQLEQDNEVGIHWIR
ncbi:toxin PIN [Peptococcaceae bacterium SCADC1_2_3]|jgi:predicted nucleic acid-binding protein|nr:toxin PIN [Peptococcaceae bacterium SCADC1_2_3]KFI35295.1 toxin PIN [Peptococcaceae bacterium SCADC1_2_3]